MDTRFAKDSNAVVPFAPSFRDVAQLGMGNFFERLFGDVSYYPDVLPRKQRNEDGSVELEFNVAGFDAEDISVRVDTVLKRLFVTAKTKDDATTKREFSTSVSLSPYTRPEDVSSRLKNGILQVVIQPTKQNENDALVEINVAAE